MNSEMTQMGITELPEEARAQLNKVLILITVLASLVTKKREEKISLNENDVAILKLTDRIKRSLKEKTDLGEEILSLHSYVNFFKSKFNEWPTTYNLFDIELYYALGQLRSSLIWANTLLKRMVLTNITSSSGPTISGAKSCRVTKSSIPSCGDLRHSS